MVLVLGNPRQTLAKNQQTLARIYPKEVKANIISNKNKMGATATATATVTSKASSPKPTDIGKFIDWVGLPIQLKLKQNQQFVMDRSGKGGNVGIWRNQPGHENLTFSVDADGRIHCVDAPDWVVDAGEKNSNGANVKTTELSKFSKDANPDRLKWKLHDDGKIESVAYPGMVLDVSKYVNGTPVTLYEITGRNQTWMPVLVDKLYDKTEFGNKYKHATDISELSLADYARAWNAPFIMELSIEGYDGCLEIPYESFCAPSSKYDVIFCILSIMLVIFAALLLYDYIRHNRNTNNNDVSISDVYMDDRLEYDT